MLTSLKIISDDMCGRNGLKSKVSTLEELYDFSQKILKNYIVRCDFWSCRHFVYRLTFIISDNAKIINVLTNILDENMIKLL